MAKAVTSKNGHTKPRPRARALLAAIAPTARWTIGSGRPVNCRWIPEVRELLELDRQRFLVVAGYRRGEADVMQKAVAVIEAEQQRADHRFALIVPEAADYQRPDPPV